MKKINLKSIKIAKFRNLENVSICDLSHAQWIFVTGANGAGKTLLLQAIAAGLYGLPLVKSMLTKNGLSDVKLECSVGIDNDIHTRFIDKKKASDSGNYRGELYPYSFLGANRIKTAYQKSDIMVAHLFSFVEKDGYSPLEAPDYMFSFLNRFSATRIELMMQLEDVIKVICDIANLESITFESRTGNAQFKEKGSNKAVSFAKLPYSTQCLVNMVVNLIGDITGNYLGLSQDLVGIAVIDSIDLHLCPTEQVEVVRKLSKHFPRLQFIVSVNNPMPLLAAPSDSVFLHLERKEDSFSVERILVRDIKKLTPNLLLSSKLFDYADIFHIEANVAEVNSEDTYAEMEKNEERRESLKARFHAEQAKQRSVEATYIK